ncbi:MAG: RdgB/HAM1 family non-canonical purine NTP pyrophosphatase [Azoarcus sp.]|jgi:XTP/dITP diphosphohydrolase|nr:RdgB/HAM1 family non-canonical purine NTP pyrophosphatase [Azoarcus sp.]
MNPDADSSSAPTQLVLASGNAKKITEMRALLMPLGLEIIPQAHLGVLESEEPHPTFVENALTKARHAARATGLPAIADDSGLCVPALGGAPGVHSARYAGEPRSDARNNAQLIAHISQLAETQRHAWYYCCLVLVHHADDPCPLIAQGQWHGILLTAPRGNGGFGYDPLFWLPELEQSAAELDPEFKNAISHRGLAMRHLFECLRSRGLKAED